MKKIFISHSSKDKELVFAFTKFLRLGLNLGRDEISCSSLSGCLPTGEAFIPAIKKAIQDCGITILLITDNFLKSQFCLAEMGAVWALGQTIFPLLVPPVTHKDISETPLSKNQTLCLYKEEDLYQLGTEFIEKKVSNYSLVDFSKCVNQFLCEIGVKRAATTSSLSAPQNHQITKYIEKLKYQECSNRAKFLLGMAYREGILIEQDLIKAMDLFIEAANDGFAPAQYALSSMYYRGEDGHQSFEKAFKWKVKASVDENPNVWESLAFLYRAGLGCQRDLNKALDCYNHAIELGDTSSYSVVAEIHSILSSSAESVEFYKKSADYGYTFSAFELGMLYKEGSSTFEPNYENAAKYFSQAAEAGMTEAKYQMGQLYYMGYATFGRDFALANKWFKRAAEEGDIRSQYNLGYAYQHGLAVERNLDSAIFWYEKAATRGHRLSQVGVADLYAQMQKRNYEKAIYWYQQAAKQDSCDAYRKLGDLFYFGLGTDVDTIKAANFYHKAAEQKDYVAQFRLEDGKNGEI